MSRMLLVFALLLAPGLASAQITSDGFGPYRWGMTMEQARTAGAATIVTPNPDGRFPIARLAQMGTRLLDRDADVYLLFSERGTLACVVTLIGTPADNLHVQRVIYDRFGQPNRVEGTSGPGVISRMLWSLPRGLTVRYAAPGPDSSGLPPTERPRIEACGIPRAEQL